MEIPTHGKVSRFMMAHSNKLLCIIIVSITLQGDIFNAQYIIYTWNLGFNYTIGSDFDRNLITICWSHLPNLHTYLVNFWLFTHYPKFNWLNQHQISTLWHQHEHTHTFLQSRSPTKPSPSIEEAKWASSFKQGAFLGWSECHKCT